MARHRFGTIFSHGVSRTTVVKATRDYSPVPPTGGTASRRLWLRPTGALRQRRTGSRRCSDGSCPIPHTTPPCSSRKVPYALVRPVRVEQTINAMLDAEADAANAARDERNPYSGREAGERGRFPAPQPDGAVRGRSGTGSRTRGWNAKAGDLFETDLSLKEGRPKLKGALFESAASRTLPEARIQRRGGR